MSAENQFLTRYLNKCEYEEASRIESKHAKKKEQLAPYEIVSFSYWCYIVLVVMKTYILAMKEVSFPCLNSFISTSIRKSLGLRTCLCR